MRQKTQAERELDAIQTQIAVDVANMQWGNTRICIRFCRVMAGAMLDACTDRTATRTVNGKEELRRYYRDGVPPEVITRLRNLVSTTDLMLRGQRPYTTLYDSDSWTVLRTLAAAVSQLGLDRAAVAHVEAVFRWREYARREALPDEETMLAFEAIVELQDYKYAAEFARQHTRTNAWKGVVRLPVDHE